MQLPNLDFDTLVQNHGMTLYKAGARDVDKMAVRLIQRGFVAKAPKKKGLGRYLTKMTKRLLAEDEVSKFEYPDTLPKGNDELYCTYRGMVIANIRKVIKYGVEWEDCEQEIWRYFCQINILHKYLQHGVLKRLPDTMTGDEAADYLGILWETWLDMFQTHPNPPKPVRGKYDSEAAEFKSTDIQALDKSGIFGEDRPTPRYLPAKACRIQLFEVYFRTAIQNQARNFLRTRERRFCKDQPMPNPHVFLADTGSSHRVARQDTENKEFWENSLVSSYPTAEEVCDARLVAENITNTEEASFQPSKAAVETAQAQVAAAGLSLDSEDGLAFYKDAIYHLSLEEISKEVKKANIDLHSEEGSMLIQFLSEGWNRNEAILHVQRLRNKQRLLQLG